MWRDQWADLFGLPSILFDQRGLRLAGPALGARQRLEPQRVGEVTYVLGEAERGRLEIIAEYAGDTAGADVLPVTVTTPERADDYLLIFRAEDSGKWVGVVEVPGVRDLAEVFIHDARERASLTADDAETVRRSVRAAPDPWVPAWQAVAQARPEGDPVREAITQELRA